MATALTRIDGTLDIITLGKTLAASGYFRDARDASQAIVKVLAGQELGISPIASMTGIYIVKERVTLSANLIAAVIKRSGRYNYRVTWEPDACVIEFYEMGESIGISRFGADDAVTARLDKGDNWQKFPRNMYFARALSNGAKWYCPDIFAGPIYTPDELGAEVDGETGEPIDVTPPPRIEVVHEPEPSIAERTEQAIEAIEALWKQEKQSGGDLTVQTAERDMGPLSDYTFEGLKRLYRTVKGRVDALPVQQHELAAA